MSKQRGSLFYKQNSWGYEIGITVNGKRQRYKKQGFATKREAEQALTKQLGLIDGGKYTGAGKQTVAQFLAAWVADYERSGRVKVTTLASVKQHVDKYLIPHLGEVQLSKLTPNTRTARP